MSKINDINLALEAEVLTLLKDNPGKKYRDADLARHCKITTNRVRQITSRLADHTNVGVHKDSCGGTYTYLLAPEPETRTFIQKPHKFDQAMIDRMNQIKADRVTLPSKTNTDDAGELSEMDRTKLRMMGSGN